ncbi:uncharacterized protein BXZ73DRAFT_78442 [Epithele typhae]|uniref:uncharacterized protein n=1 Tax=Epithele typhae TaxID=378194 RepID=UPI002007DF7E|nr:uncharacterized protein BXZ73DRAFT_78442 [Epithele typhae]KAH9928000.1 hypothetical protein BXZ73DRAFT_78442 [Epithele typhae]
MFQPLRSALPASRPAFAIAVRPPTVSRHLLSTAALAPPMDDVPLPIFDIFDAPARLGESSKLLARAAFSTIARRTVPRPASPRRPAPRPLPQRRSSTAPRAPALAQCPRRPLPAPLPPTEVFDGPSRLRPYGRGGARSGPGSAFAFAPLAAALAGAAVIFGVDVSPGKDAPFLTKLGRWVPDDSSFAKHAPLASRHGETIGRKPFCPSHARLHALDLV